MRVLNTRKAVTAKQQYVPIKFETAAVQETAHSGLRKNEKEKEKQIKGTEEKTWFLSVHPIIPSPPIDPALRLFPFSSQP